MTVLYEGTYRNEELIEWFGIEPNSFYGRMDTYFEILKSYCKYERINRSKFTIFKVYINVYNPYKYNRRVIRIGRLIEHFWNENGIDTIENVYNKIIQGTNEFGGYPKGSVIKNIIKYIKWAYGDCFSYCGLKGNCYTVFCVKDKNGNCRFLNKEEQKVLEKLVCKYLGDELWQRFLFYGFWKDYKEKEEMITDVMGITDDRMKGIKQEFFYITGEWFEVGISLVRFEDEEDEEFIEEQESGGLNIGRVL